MKKSGVIALLLICLGSYVASAQLKIIRGTVRDAHTQEKIPFAAVHFTNTTTGIATDADGHYSFMLSSLPSDSLSVRVIGYTPLTLPVNQAADTQSVNFDLFRAAYSLKEFVVHGGADPALILLKKIIRHKPQNNNDRLSNYKYKVYNKLEVDLDKINREKFARSKFFRPFAFIFNNIDSTSEDKPFLPIFLTETLSDFYYRRQPKKEKEVILASRTSGIKNASLTQFLGSMYQNVNIYDNFIPVFDKKFASPISDFATVYYDYKIVDTQFIDHRKCFHVTFEPKRKGENTFFGDFWVNDTTFAIQKMNMQVSNSANINFVGRVSLVQEYTPLNDTLWFLTKDKFVADFVLNFIGTGKKTIGAIGRKTTDYADIAVDDTAATDIFNEKQYRNNNIYILPGALDKNEDYWASHRIDSLSKNEKAIYAMVDTLQKMPLFKTYSNIIQFIATGTKAFGPLEFGPYYYLFSENHLENYRLRFDVGTTTKFSKNMYLNGYLAYGFADRAFKGKIADLWLLNRNPRMYLYGSYTHDLDNGVHYYDEISTDNIFTLAIRKPGVPQKFMLVDEKRLEFYKEWFIGFSGHVSFTNTKFTPYAPLPSKGFFTDNGTGFESLNDTRIDVKLRFAYREKFLEGDYYRISLGSDYPIMEFDFAAGLKGILKSDYNYQRIGMSISDHLSIPPIGTLYYNLFGGKIFGTLPYPLLEIHPGNEIYYYDPYAFNMMNRYEFLSDQFAGFNIEHKIGGGIFNYIPWVRKLKWRQFWTAKGIIGKLSDANQALNLGNGYPFQTLQDKPYLELGTGVENILHFLRVDFIWRVAPNGSPGESIVRRFGVFGSFQLQF